jgi:hypothetical protein
MFVVQATRLTPGAFTFILITFETLQAGVFVTVSHCDASLTLQVKARSLPLSVESHQGLRSFRRLFLLLHYGRSKIS